MVLPVPLGNGNGECKGMGVGLAFLSLFDGALYASVLLRNDDAANCTNGTTHVSSSSSSSDAMQMQMLPCGLVVGMGDGLGCPCVLSVSIARSNNIPVTAGAGDGDGIGVWLMTHAHRRSNSIRGKSKGRGGDNSNTVVFLPVCPATVATTRSNDSHNGIEGSSEMSSRETLWTSAWNAGGLVRRVLGLPDINKSCGHNCGHSNSSGSGVDGRDREMSLALAMQEVVLRMQTLSSQQEGTTFTLVVPPPPPDTYPSNQSVN